jgi:hypothetical protein
MSSASGQGLGSRQYAIHIGKLHLEYPPPCTMEPGLRNFINCQRIAQKTERSKRAISPAQFMNGRSNRHDRASEGG